MRPDWMELDRGLTRGGRGGLFRFNEPLVQLKDKFLKRKKSLTAFEIDKNYYFYFNFLYFFCESVGVGGG